MRWSRCSFHFLCIELQSKKQELRMVSGAGDLHERARWAGRIASPHAQNTQRSTAAQDYLHSWRPQRLSLRQHRLLRRRNKLLA